MTYDTLLSIVATIQDFDYTYSRNHLTVEECFGDEDSNWNDEVTEETFNLLKGEGIDVNTLRQQHGYQNT